MFVEISTWMISFIFMLILFRIAYSLIIDLYTVLKYYQDVLRDKEIGFLHKKFGSNTDPEFRKSVLQIADKTGVGTELRNGILSSQMLVKEKQILKEVKI